MLCIFLWYGIWALTKGNLDWLQWQIGIWRIQGDVVTTYEMEGTVISSWFHNHEMLVTRKPSDISIFQEGDPFSREDFLSMDVLTSRSNWNLEVSVFVEGGKPEKNPRSKARKKTTNSTHTRRRVRESNPGHSAGRRSLIHCANHAPSCCIACIGCKFRERERENPE